MKGKASVPVYVYLVPKKDWPKKVKTHQVSGAYNFTTGIFTDRDPKVGTLLGYEFLDCYGVEINGKKVL